MNPVQSALASQRDSVYAVPILDRWLVHAPLHGVTALVNAAGIRSLRCSAPLSASSELDELAGALAEPSRPEPRPRTGPLRPEFLGLVPTRGCNLACSYCGFGARGSVSERMSFEVAVRAVDWYAAQPREDGQSPLAVHFFGGEPFQAPEVVEVAVHRARALAAASGRTARFEVATNGCFDDALRSFVADYFDTVVLSLDGPEAVHEKHRPSRTGLASFDVVAGNAAALAAAPLRLCLRACVTCETVGALPETTAWFCETFRPDAIVYETLQPTRESEQAGLRPPGPREFAVQCYRSFEVARQFGVTPVHSASTIHEIRHSPCPVGRDSAIVMPDGRVSACYLDEVDWEARGLDLYFGRVAGPAAIDFSADKIEAIRALTVDRSRCAGCLARWHCAGGCQVNHSYPGSATGYDDFCVQTRLLVILRLIESLGSGFPLASFLDDRAALDRVASRPSDRLTELAEGDER